MVNNLGQWTEEKDYSTYPKENGVIMIIWQSGLEKNVTNQKHQWRI